MFIARIKVIVTYALLLVAPAVYGGVCGIFVGESNEPAAILAAVLPVGLSGIGALVFFKSANGSEQHDVRIMVSLFLIMFSISLLLGAQQGWRAVDERDRDNLADAFMARFTYLQDCSVEELKINEFREKLELPPLESSVFCQ